MKKSWYIMIFYSHIESYKRLYGIHMKRTKRESVFRYRPFCPVTLLSPVGNRSCDNPRDRDFQECTKMMLLSWMSLPLPEGRWYVPRNPTGAKWKLLCHSRWECCHLLFISRGSCGPATPLRFKSLKLLSRRRQLAADPLCRETLSQMQGLGVN